MRRRVKVSERKGSRPGNTAKQDARESRFAERRKQALSLRLAGATLQQISDQLGYGNSLGNVRRDLDRELEALGPDKESVEQLRATELARLEADRLSVEQRLAAVLKDPDVTNLEKHIANCRAVEAKGRIAQRKAKLEGLDKASKVELTGPNGGPIETVDVSKLPDAQLEVLARSYASFAGGGGARDTSQGEGAGGDGAPVAGGRAPN